MALRVDKPEELGLEARACRSGGHALEPLDTRQFRWTKTNRAGVQMAEVRRACRNGCGVERVHVWEIHFHGKTDEIKAIYPAGGHYDYPDGYLMVQGFGRVDRSSALILLAQSLGIRRGRA